MRNIMILAAAIMVGCGDKEGDTGSDTAEAQDTDDGVLNFLTETTWQPAIVGLHYKNKEREEWDDSHTALITLL